MKPDDGLIAPAGYEIERWPDGSPKMIQVRGLPKGQYYLHREGRAADHTDSCPGGCRHNTRPINVAHWRIALKKLPEKKLLNFREAVAAHGEGKNIRCEGEQHFWWHNSRSYPQSGGVAAVPIQWMIDRTDFYIQENPS